MVRVDTQFYTPKTYGYEGLTFKGHQVDRIITAGSNCQVFTYDLNTWGLFKFHVRRALLNAILEVMAVYEAIPAFVKQMLLAPALGTTDYVQFEDTFDELWQAIKIYMWLQLQRLMVMARNPRAMMRVMMDASRTDGGWASLIASPPSSTAVGAIGASPEYVALLQHNTKNVHVAVPLTFISRVAPPPPLFPQAARMPDGSVVEPDPKQVEAVKQAIEQEAMENNLHVMHEKHRLIDEASDVLCWAAIAQLKIVTMYERFGVMGPDDSSKIVALARDKLALCEGRPGPEMLIRFPQARYERRFKPANVQRKTLEVVFLKKAEPYAVTVEVCRKIASFTDRKHSQVSFDDLVRQETVGPNVASPNVFMLLGSKAGLNGFPACLLDGTTVYSERWSQSASPSAKLFVRALALN